MATLGLCISIPPKQERWQLWRFELILYTRWKPSARERREHTKENNKIVGPKSREHRKKRKHEFLYSSPFFIHSSFFFFILSPWRVFPLGISSILCRSVYIYAISIDQERIMVNRVEIKSLTGSSMIFEHTVSSLILHFYLQDKTLSINYYLLWVKKVQKLWS